jgi:hypothetical protein
MTFVAISQEEFAQQLLRMKLMQNRREQHVSKLHSFLLSGVVKQIRLAWYFELPNA